MTATILDLAPHIEFARAKLIRDRLGLFEACQSDALHYVQAMTSACRDAYLSRPTDLPDVPGVRTAVENATTAMSEAVCTLNLLCEAMGFPDRVGRA